MAKGDHVERSGKEVQTLETADFIDAGDGAICTLKKF